MFYRRRLCWELLFFTRESGRSTRSLVIGLINGVSNDNNNTGNNLPITHPLFTYTPPYTLPLRPSVRVKRFQRRNLTEVVSGFRYQEEVQVFLLYFYLYFAAWRIWFCTLTALVDSERLSDATPRFFSRL